MNKRDKLIHIHHCRGAGWKTIKKLLVHDPELKHIYHMSIEDLCTYLQMLPHHAKVFFEDLHQLDMSTLLSEYEKDGIFIITIFDHEYPSHLKEIYDPPWVLYGMGQPSLLNHHNILSVVGTRKPSKLGLLSLEKILAPFVDRKWTIVSGLALGIDGYAHQLSLSSYTVAVLGSGLYCPYPRQHRALFNKIISDHAAISEYPPHTSPQKWRFPERNRIISGLSLGTLVVEAKERSGSLITADQALEQGRDVFALPGSILDDNALGTNKLIQQGAKLVLSSEDILNELKFY
ncbi:DNA processing protein [Scopulibacillus daqui]|uniref:DNA processing protein n=1 Tax=Scopulibacillus daqui TaxID=1469162 RepID=A0ABS2PXY1_9BACL|nr:DNA processing protein [Scopulibacillus daqui]